MRSAPPLAGVPTTGAPLLKPIAFLALLTVGVLWPAVRDFASRPMIGTGDSSIFYWAWWHLPRALADGRNPLRTDGLMYPVGVDLSVTVTAPLAGLLSGPVRAVAGPEAQVNAVLLGAAFGAAVVTYLLAHRLTSCPSASLLAGAAFAFTPFWFVHQPEHLNLIGTAVVPLSLLATLRWVEAPGTRRAVALGASLGVAALTDPQLAVIAATGCAVVIVRSGPTLPGNARDLLVIAGSTIVVASPVLLPLVGGLLRGESSAPPPVEDLATTSSSPLAWVEPAARHPWFGDLVPDAWQTASEGVASPGLVLVVLALAGSRVAPRGRRPWVAVFLVGAVLSLGPYLGIGNRVTDLPLPFRVLVALPLVDTFRSPGRFALLGVLAVCLLASITLTELMQRRPGRRWLLLAIVVAVAAVELLPGRVTSRSGGAPVPYAAIRDDSGTGAVLELPLQWSTGVRLVGYENLNVTLFTAWATVHERPYVGGSVSRLSEDRLTRLEATPLYRQIRSLQGDPGLDTPVTFSAEALRRAGIGYVIYHRNVPLPALRSHIESLDLPVLSDDGVVRVWKVPG